jgi:hypothetical protein
MRNVDKGPRAVGILHKIHKMNAHPRAEPNDLIEAMQVRLERSTLSQREVGSKLRKRDQLGRGQIVWEAVLLHVSIPGP